MYVCIAIVLACTLIRDKHPPRLICGRVSTCPYINLSTLKSLLQIVIYSFIRNLANQRQVRYSDLFLLCRVECRLLDVRLAAPSGSSTSCSGRFTSGFIALGPTTDTLQQRICQI